MAIHHILLFTFLLVDKVLFSGAILIKPVVDERVELISIAFRLAECDEYSSNVNQLYVNRINAHFEKYKSHDLIKYIRKIRNHGIGYDAVARMAVNIGDAPEFKPIIEFNNTIPEQRWGKTRALKFLKHLQTFYKDADCESFFKSEQSYYKEVVEAFMPNYQLLDLNWYTEFYGTPPSEEFKIVIAPGNGGNNYGPSLTYANGKKEFYAIMGAWNFYKDGTHLFEKSE